MKQLVLASQSPRRAELLGQIGVKYTAIASVIDESQQAQEAPLHYVQRLAAEKASKVFAMLDSGLQGLEPGNSVVLGADTIVYTEEQIMGKPRDKR